MTTRARMVPGLPVVVAGLAAVLVPAYFLLPRLPFVDPPLGAQEGGNIQGVPAHAGEAVTLGAFICAAHSSPTLTGATVGVRGPLEITATLAHSFDAEDPSPGTYALGVVGGTAPDFEDVPENAALALGGQVSEVRGTTVDNDCDDPDDVTQIVVSGVPDRDDVPSRIYEISVDYDAWGRSWTQDIAVDWRWRAQR